MADRQDEIYLDWNATGPPLPAVVASIASAMQQAWGNPASVHGAGRRARAQIEATRESLADLLGSDPRDVVFTSGGTEANNLALQGAIGLATSRLEHPSVTRVAERLEAGGVPVAWLAVTREGWVDPDSLGPALQGLPRGSVVAVSAVNHETGVIQPLQALAQRAWTAGARLHVDAVQALGKLEPSEFSHADSLSVAAHKIRGPKGIGALVWHGAGLRPVLVGGGQERGLRPGTQDAALCAGFAAAIDHARSSPAAYLELAGARDRIEAQLLRCGQRNGTPEPRVPHVANVSVDEWSGDELVAALDLEGIRISSGSACSAGTAEPSPVIQAMQGADRARRAIRISLGEPLGSTQMVRVLAVLGRLLDNAQQHDGSREDATLELKFG